MATTVENSANIRFLSIEDFKSEIGKSGQKADIVINPNTGLLFMSIGGKSYKVQQTIDPKLEIRVLVDDTKGLDDACLVNVKASTENIKFSL